MDIDETNQVAVAPFAGAWIEIHTDESEIQESESRSLRGSVD